MFKFLVSLFLLSEIVCFVASVRMTKVSEENTTYSNSTLKTDKRNSDPINDIGMIVAQEPVPHPVYPYIFINPPEYSMVIPGEPLAPPEFEATLQIELNDGLPTTDFPDMILQAGYFEGDIPFYSIEDVPAFFDPEMETVPIVRNAVVNPNKLWKDGVIPYAISSAYGGEDRKVIARAMNQFHLLTCLKFVPRIKHTNFISIHKGSGCSSTVGLDRRPGPQSVTLGNGCLYVGIVIHELMHAIGFWHEQSRPDRDGYIRINWQNIKSGFEYNFKKLSNTDVQDLEVTYDPESIMHYGPRSFAKHPGLLTIEPRTHGVEIGQRRGFSEKDLLKVNALYTCHLQPGTGGTTGGTGGTGGGGSECVDDYDPYLCNYWAQKGECHQNPQFMQMLCKKSCNTCGVVVEICRDENVHCGAWASTGECYKNSGYMYSYCKKSCNACDLKSDVSAAEAIAANRNITVAGTLECKDFNDDCAAWSKNGKCVSNPPYMLVFCRKSCGRCQ